MTSWNFPGGLKYILRSFITSVVFCCIADPCFKGGFTPVPNLRFCHFLFRMDTFKMMQGKYIPGLTPRGLTQKAG